ncbi:MAG: 2-polyprenyl-6-methoxyphenol hydroxylase-related FAD-dependent oxidoreductase [Parcubacteria group bacterium]|nr:2-polyprenyl-6-methoxyphenol hydroxylase-related FAD-dependent oxidoreductase [Parcubacteria group bacterium]
MKILIVGGGIAGCACAALLQKEGFTDVTLIDKAPEFRNIGYLMGIWNTGRKVLKELGIDMQIEKNSCEYDSDIVFDRNGKLLKLVPGEEFNTLGTVSIRRNDLHQSLFNLLDKTSVRFNTACVSIKQNEEKAEVEFSNGTKEVFDLVIGADGVHSSVREMIFGKNFLRRYGWRVWMWWLPREHESSNSVTSYYGSGKICGILPFFDTSVAILFAKVPLKRSNEKDQQPAVLFKDFCSEVQNLITTMPSVKEMYHDDIAYVEMPLWHKGNVVLIGDSQHAVSPTTGMGASMAMEDAWVLVQELKRGETIAKALSSFATRREKRIRRFRRIVNQMDRWTMAHGLLGYVRNKIITVVPARYFIQVLRHFVEAEI